MDAVPYVPEEPGPYRLDFYFLCLPKQEFSVLREGINNGRIQPRSPEIKSIRFVPMTSLRNMIFTPATRRCLLSIGLESHPNCIQSVKFNENRGSSLICSESMSRVHKGLAVNTDPKVPGAPSG